MGELLLSLERPTDALIAFSTSQHADPKRLRGIYGVAKSAELAGDHTRARASYAELLQQFDGDSSDRVEIRQAQTYLRGR